MRNEFTKGPWFYIKPSVNNKFPGIQRGTSGGFFIHDENIKRAIADANIILNAPEMFELLIAASQSRALILYDDLLQEEIKRLVTKIDKGTPNLKG